MAGNLCWFQITSTDLPKTADFFKALFGWETTSFMEGHIAIKTSGSVQGGFMQKPPQAPATDVYIFVQVDDVAETLKQAENMGGRMMLPRTEIPENGFIAFFADPDGNPIGIFSDK